MSPSPIFKRLRPCVFFWRAHEARRRARRVFFSRAREARVFFEGARGACFFQGRARRVFFSRAREARDFYEEARAGRVGACLHLGARGAWARTRRVGA